MGFAGETSVGSPLASRAIKAERACADNFIPELPERHEMMWKEHKVHKVLIGGQYMLTKLAMRFMWDQRAGQKSHVVKASA